MIHWQQYNDVEKIQLLDIVSAEKSYLDYQIIRVVEFSNIFLTFVYQYLKLKNYGTTYYRPPAYKA